MKPETKLQKTPTDKPAVNPPPASSVIEVDFVPPLPLWKQRTTVRPRFTLPWRLLRIDEADAIPPVAQVRFLTLLDDLPHGTAIACTSNCKLRDFEERFQTRFQAFEIAPPITEEIISLLRRYPPDEPEVVNAANFADGNVRQALLDAKGLVQRNTQLHAALQIYSFKHPFAFPTKVRCAISSSRFSLAGW